MITREELVEKGWTEIIPIAYVLPVKEGVEIGIKFAQNGYVEYINLINHKPTAIPLPPYSSLADLESLVALLTGKEQVCEWQVSKCDGGLRYDTQCGDVMIVAGTVKDAELAFCSCCGKRIVEKE